MKTFKLISVGVQQDNQIIDFPLVDGIIINQENSHRMWILEMFIDRAHKELFEEWKANDELLEARAVISYPENEPAGFLVAVDTIQDIGDHISVLLKGRLKRARSQYAEHLLEELIMEGLGGPELLARFEHDMQARPRLKREHETK